MYIFIGKLLNILHINLYIVVVVAKIGNVILTHSKSDLISPMILLRYLEMIILAWN